VRGAAIRRMIWPNTIFSLSNVSRTCEDDVEWSTFSYTSLLHQRGRIARNHLKNKPLFRLGIHFCIALADDVQRQRPISIFNGGGLWCGIENSGDHFGSNCRVALARNRLMDYCGVDVVVHCHLSGSNPRLLLHLLQDSMPLIRSTQLEQNVDFLASWRIQLRSMGSLALFGSQWRFIAATVIHCRGGLKANHKFAAKVSNRGEREDSISECNRNNRTSTIIGAMDRGIGQWHVAWTITTVHKTLLRESKRLRMYTHTSMIPYLAVVLTPHPNS
jgi:hypothetical protein